MSLYGAITNMRIVRKDDGKSRGYAFCTFKFAADANHAVKNADGRRVDGRNILVDREFGRTKKQWLPMRLGGGKGGESRRYVAKSGPTGGSIFEASLTGETLIKEVKEELRVEREREREVERE